LSTSQKTSLDLNLGETIGPIIFFFSKKEARGLVLLRRRYPISKQQSLLPTSENLLYCSFEVHCKSSRTNALCSFFYNVSTKEETGGKWFPEAISCFAGWFIPTTVQSKPGASPKKTIIRELKQYLSITE
jgi:hypothetical protein